MCPSPHREQRHIFMKHLGCIIGSFARPALAPGNFLNQESKSLENKRLCCPSQDRQLWSTAPLTLKWQDYRVRVWELQSSSEECKSSHWEELEEWILANFGRSSKISLFILPAHVYNNLTIIIFFFQSFKIFPRWAVQVQPRRRARPFLSDVSSDGGGSGAEGKRSRQSANQNPCEEQEAERTSEMRRSSSKNEPWSD